MCGAFFHIPCANTQHKARCVNEIVLLHGEHRQQFALAARKHARTLHYMQKTLRFCEAQGCGVVAS